MRPVKPIRPMSPMGPVRPVRPMQCFSGVSRCIRADYGRTKAHYGESRRIKNKNPRRRVSTGDCEIQIGLTAAEAGVSLAIDKNISIVGGGKFGWHFLNTNDDIQESSSSDNHKTSNLTYNDLFPS